MNQEVGARRKTAGPQIKRNPSWRKEGVSCVDMGHYAKWRYPGSDLRRNPAPQPHGFRGCLKVRNILRWPAMVTHISTGEITSLTWLTKMESFQTHSYELLATN